LQVVLAARVGIAALAVTLASCVNLSYPPGATRDADGGFQAHVANGLPCRSGSECQSGSCADGLCCNEACVGICLTCKRPGSVGRCTIAEEGTDVRDQCTDEGAASCHQNGVCDGAGACENYTLGTTCKPGLCNLGQLTPVGRCDETHTCVQPAAHTCRPFQCSAVDFVCLTACTTNDECASPTRCVNGTCGARPIGSPCDLPSDCDSTFCEDHVCCATQCEGGCRSCGLMGSAGTCTFVPAGVAPDPATICKVMDASTCQTDGTCDGAGGCRVHPAGKVCVAATCSTATLHAASACDGKGHCQTPASVTCGGYTCATALACRTSCAADADCASPSVCGNSACGGLTAQYFRTTNLTDQAFTRTDPNINFNWAGGSPMGLNVDSFSVRWRGKVTARFSGPYTFFAASDDGERLWVGPGAPIIDHWSKHASVPEDVSMPVSLIAGQPTDITFEYFESGGDANVRVYWQSAMEPKALVPTSALSPQ
jgi:PA14 domain